MGRFRKITGAIVLVCAIYIAYIMRDTFDPESIRGKKVIVTGASTGIGEQIAYHYARLGAKILITARRENLLKEVSKKCIELGAQEAHYLPMDMAKVNDTGRLIVEAEKKLGGLDYLVLNHALYYWELWDGNIEKLQNIMNVNFMSFVSLASKALPMLTKTNGSIVVVSSAAGVMGNPGLSKYSASKFALGGFFEALRYELMWKKINVPITICILGAVDTDTMMNQMQKLASPERFQTLKQFFMSTEVVAIEVIKSGARGDRIAYFSFPPGLLQALHTVNVIAPSLLDGSIVSQGERIFSRLAKNRT
ncbi:hydroxysteroid 11-beta-dehydrogenase 1-like protein isoform X1 [Ptychodera flava]|uniref:hydroxysteroid 11-beta-dehydrogenase 1-like protein isoform X1 n=1 Tax=Ptychodera flava TaxID=63121 RepID=UPI00396A2AA7